MPELTRQDATRILPLIDQALGDLDLYAAAGRRYCEHIASTGALRGDMSDALLVNGEKIAAACQRVRDKASGWLTGMRAVTVHGALTAAESADLVGAVELPDFL